MAVSAHDVLITAIFTDSLILLVSIITFIRALMGSRLSFLIVINVCVIVASMCDLTFDLMQLKVENKIGLAKWETCHLPQHRKPCDPKYKDDLVLSQTFILASSLIWVVIYWTVAIKYWQVSFEIPTVI